MDIHGLHAQMQSKHGANLESKMCRDEEFQGIYNAALLITPPLTVIRHCNWAVPCFG